MDKRNAKRGQQRSYLTLSRLKHTAHQQLERHRAAHPACDGRARFNASYATTNTTDHGNMGAATLGAPHS